MLTLHSNLSSEELDKKIKELDRDKISLNLAYLTTHNLDGSRKNKKINTVNKDELKNIKVEDLDEDMQNYYKELLDSSKEKLDEAISHGVDLINGEAEEVPMELAGQRPKHFKYKGHKIYKKGNGFGSYTISGVDEKETFNLTNIEQVKKFINSLHESKETDILKARSIIADQIRGEWDADRGYTKAAADLAELKDIDTKEAQDMMLDIASEEHVHVGELETAYDAFDPKLFDELEDGHNEADEKAEPANDLDYDIAEEPVAEGLDLEDGVECAWCHEKFPKSDIEFEKDFGPLCHKCIQAIKSHEGEDSLEFEEALKESVESDQIEKIEEFMDRLYEMRKVAIANEGEYSIGNLVFKELRNKGYLDDLRDTKKQLTSKDLSLESLGEAKNNTKNKKEALPSVLKDISIIDITAKSPLWTVVVSPDFLKMYNDLTKIDREKTTELLNKFVPSVKLDGRWPIDTDLVKEHHYPIIELKLGTSKTGQPIRILYFTKHIGNTRYMIFGAILVHTEPNLSKKERELCDNSYKIFLN